MVIFTGALWGALSLTKTDAQAKRISLKRIDEIVSEHSATSDGNNPAPFTILEIVPDRSEAKLGYLVGGEEPIDDARSIKDMPSTDERLVRFKRFKEKRIGIITSDNKHQGETLAELWQNYDKFDNGPGELDFANYSASIKSSDHGGAFGWEDYKEPPASDAVKRFVEIRGSFRENAKANEGSYARNELSSAFTKFEEYVYEKNEDGTGKKYTSVKDIYNDQNTLNLQLYRKVAVFKTGSTKNGSYKLTLKKIEQNTGLPVYGDGLYNLQFFKATWIEDSTTLHEGDIVFRGNNDGTITYFGTVTNNNGTLGVMFTSEKTTETDAFGTLMSYSFLKMLSEPDEAVEPNKVKTEADSEAKQEADTEKKPDSKDANSDAGAGSSSSSTDTTDKEANAESSESPSADATSSDTPTANKDADSDSSESPSPTADKDDTSSESPSPSATATPSITPTATPSTTPTAAKDADNSDASKASDQNEELPGSFSFEPTGLGMDSFGPLEYPGERTDASDYSEAEEKESAAASATPSITPDASSKEATPTPTESEQESADEDKDKDADATPAAKPTEGDSEGSDTDSTQSGEQTDSSTQSDENSEANEGAGQDSLDSNSNGNDDTSASEGAGDSSTPNDTKASDSGNTDSTNTDSTSTDSANSDSATDDSNKANETGSALNTLSNNGGFNRTRMIFDGLVKRMIQPSHTMLAAGIPASSGILMEVADTEYFADKDKLAKATYSKYYIVSEASADTPDAYYISGATKDDSKKAPYGLEYAYSPIRSNSPDRNTYNEDNAPETHGSEKIPYYIKIADPDAYIYEKYLDDSGNETDRRNESEKPYSGKFDYDFVADYQASPLKKVEYQGGIKNNEWFKKYVFDLTTQEELDSLSIDVVSALPSEVNTELLERANLIYFAGGRNKTVGDRYEDLKPEVAVEILRKVAEDSFPVIIERSTYNSNLSCDSGVTGLGANINTKVRNGEDSDVGKAERVNTTLLMLELMQTKVTAVKLEDWNILIDDFKPSDTSKPIKPVSDIIIKDSAVASKYKGYLLDKEIKDADTEAPYFKKETNKIYISKKRSDLLKGLNFDIKAKNDVSYVNGSVFVNDDWIDEDKDSSGISVTNPSPDKLKVVYSDFNAQYTKGKIESGFLDIVSEYEAEKTVISTYGNWSDFSSKISKATSIRYILNNNSARHTVKSKLRILDIEPFETAQYSDQNALLKDAWINGRTYEFSNSGYVRDIITKEWVRDNIYADKTNKTAEIEIIQMGTKEFIGINEDLNANYDMIYLGMDTMLMNTDVKDYSNSSPMSHKTIYNDTDMNGLVYSHVGDSTSISVADVGDLNGRLSGNDITFDKKRELTEYVKAGYALLLSDDFFIKNDDGQITNTLNENKLDKASNLYAFLSEVALKKSDDEYVYFGKNVYRRGTLEGGTNAEAVSKNRKKFAEYVNISKLDIEVISKPVEYNGIDENGHSTRNYLKKDENGFYSLKYEVKLNNDAALDAGGTTYDCRLYLDLDADGKFEEGESQGALSIEGEQYEDGHFKLHAGQTYKIERRTPEDYVGFLSWKLEFVQNKGSADGQTEDYAATVRSAITGFSAVPATAGSVPEIKVLQIVDKRRNTMDLNSAAFRSLYDEIKDFKVNIKQISVEEYVRKLDSENHAGTKTYFDYLSQFDMVVVGFDDDFEFIYSQDGDRVPVTYPSWFNSGVANILWANAYPDAILGIREYALSGRSILFSHDLSNKFYNGVRLEGLTNIFLRDIMGMDRFGIRSEDNQKLKYINDMTFVLGQEDHKAHNNVDFPKNYDSKYDYAKLKGNSDIDRIGFTDFHQIRYLNNRSLGINNRRATSGSIPYMNMIPWDYNYGNSGNSETETVTAINEGQITQYPFLITEGTGGTHRPNGEKSTFEVAATHAQYFQLNLDTDSRDANANDDVVVWYTISNSGDAPAGVNHNQDRHSYYQAVHNDVRNNYYIYSKGNVMYTGAGHWFVNSDLERKLFVNTLVASYNNGLHAPRISYKENPWESSAEATGLYLPYDVDYTSTAADDSSLEGADSNGGFLNNRVTVNFKTMNNNFRESTNSLHVKYYVETRDAGALNVDGKHYKEIGGSISLKVSDGIGALTPVANMALLDNYKIYQLEFDVAQLGLGGGGGVLPEDMATIYIQIGTEELSSGTVASLKATERLCPLSVYTTRLFDLE